MSGVIKEFKEFLNRGGFFELAVAFVMGVASKEVIDSIVGFGINPLLGYVLPGEGLMGFLTFGEGGSIGAIIAALISFTATAGVVFMLVKAYNRMQERMMAKPDEDKPAPSEDVTLLREIRDQLKVTNMK